MAGAKDVGKSSLIARFVDGIFNITSLDTIGVAFKRKKLEIDENRELDLTIWDFAGEEKYRYLFPQYVKGAAGALILFDTTREETFDDVKNWMKIIDDNAEENIVKVLIGTKIDLKDEREINVKQATAFSDKYGCYAEPMGTSAKTGENVELAFKKVAEGIVKRLLQRCSNCGEIFSKKLRICNYCGQSADVEAIST